MQRSCRRAVGRFLVVVVLLLLSEIAGTAGGQSGAQRKPAPVPVQPTSLSAADIYSRHSEEVALIETFDGAGAALAQGSGVVLTTDGIFSLVATNAHVIANATSANIIIEGTAYSVRSVLHNDEVADVCILSINAQNLATVTLAKEPPRIGSRVVAIGNPLGYQLTVSEGLLSGVRRTKDGSLVLQHTAPISHGSSGGALFDEYGHLIGLTSLTVVDAQNLNFAVSAESLARALRQSQLNPNPILLHISTAEAAVARAWHTRVLGERSTGVQFQALVAELRQEIDALATIAKAFDRTSRRGLAVQGMIACLREDWRGAIPILQATLKAPEWIDEKWIRTVRLFLAASLAKLANTGQQGTDVSVGATLEAVGSFLQTSPPSLLFPEDDAESVNWALAVERWAQPSRKP